MPLSQAIRKFVEPGMNLHLGLACTPPLAVIYELVRQFRGKGPRFTLFSLGLTTEFLDLPEGGLHERFGDEAAQVHRFASGRGHAPLMPVVPDEPVAATWELGYPDGDRERLLQYIARLIELLTSQLAARHTHAGAVRLAFVLETRAAYEEVIRPAHPTREVAQLLELVRLRLEYRALPARVEEIALVLVPAAADVRQTQLIDRPRRDAEAADRALARLRAEFGTANVVRARLREGHLPEASFLWEPLGTPLEQPDRAPAATPRGNGPFAAPRTAGPPKGPVGLLVHRLFEHPQALPPRRHHLRDDGWLIRGPGHGAVVKFIGPYVVSGGWWVRPLHREYHFAQTQRGDVLWVYFDRENRLWRLQGRVE